MFLLQRLDLVQWLAVLRQSPIGEQFFPVDDPPLLYMGQSTPGKLAAHDAPFYLDDNFVVSVDGVKMRWGVILHDNIPPEVGRCVARSRVAVPDAALTGMGACIKAVTTKTRRHEENRKEVKDRINVSANPKSPRSRTSDWNTNR